jgi:AraC-like DNA-binding protein
VLIDPTTFRRLVRARDLLADDTLSVRDVAARVRLSPFHFIRVFGAVFGDTPHQFRTRVRLERARALLARGSSVTDTCFEIGFSSVGSFSALFTRWNGAPPSAFRRTVAVPRDLAISPAGCLGLLEQFWRSAPPTAWA